MKPLLVSVAAVLLAGSLSAGEGQKAGEARQDTQPAATGEQPVVDSPLVAAAKRTNRGASKTMVITDETVKTSTGRLTTSNSTYSPVLPAVIEPSQDVLLNQQRARQKAEAAEKAAAAKEAEEKRQKELARRARMAAEAEEYEAGYDDDMDPARVEGEMAGAGKKNKP